MPSASRYSAQAI